ncbi:hypothetical protein P4V37_17055 [Bacillus subtilis]|uniref:Uncharacterized protein n=3 Tax=Bacillus subtilis TaxID=1423 RepID=A0AC62A0P0_BACIU|nr:MULTISPECIES: hypothetical protein [Bacillus]MDF4199349.1 hypothetical protein [Bacillus subtilis]MDF4216789.1 hypothetical protein [Bacillus subtilis]MDH3083367.1 hypothetical protein [Bacillus subtilis]MDQ2206959.1 hypothetical protein [Bacillus sp. WR13]MED1982327.1 hypothetical protein [Bacillus subtilis]
MMFETIRVGDWLIKADVEETRKQYEKDIEDMCECGNCLNYYEAVNELPVQKAQVLESFGLIPSKCTDINYHGVKDHLHFYIASYFIVGRIVEGKQEWNPKKIDFSWHISFSVPQHQIYIPKGFPKPIIQLDCVTLLPWVIDQPYE